VFGMYDNRSKRSGKFNIDEIVMKDIFCDRGLSDPCLKIN
jgi:hypothetical protein